MIQSGANLEATEDSYKDWHVTCKGPDGKNSSQAYTFTELKNMYKNEKINLNTKVWAQGMEGWKSIKNVTQLKWTLVAENEAILNETELAVKCLDILILIANFYPSIDIDGGIIRPMPKVKRYLSDIRCLPHLCQLLLTFEPRIVERVCTLLYHVMVENPVVNQLFLTGFFFFVMMYTGSNILPITKFLKYTHTKQSYHLSQNQSKNTISQLSILSSILPDSLICYLYNYDEKKFSEAYLGNYENPEIIWSNEMRTFMIGRIALHLADFTPRLKSNIKTLYIYCPIPCIEFDILKEEIFCGMYYLRHLCDEILFPNWEIKDPVKVLRDILEAWKFEVNKKAPTMSIDDALSRLGLKTGIKHEDSVLRRAYFKLAAKYHPDKNPDGREIFESIVSAYEYLCSREVKTNGPKIDNLILILKSQSILFKRCSEELKPYKYSGYPMLIHTIKVESKKSDLFSNNNTNSLLLPATELCHFSIKCSVLNAEELRREGGIEILKEAMERCVEIMSDLSKPENIETQICSNVIQCFTASSMFEGFRILIFELPGYVKNLCHILLYQKNLTLLAGKVCECLISLVVDEMIQMRLLEMGILYHLILFLFSYDYTLCESGINSNYNTNIQMLFNELASLSMQTIAIMDSTSFEKGGVYVVIHNLLIRLLTYHIIYSLKSNPTHEILKLLNTNHETPYYIWNNNTRKQLIDFVTEARKPNPDNERLNYEIASTFQYDEHKNLLYIGNIYVNIYNKYPNYELYNKDEFILSLFAFISIELKQFVSFLNKNLIKPKSNIKIEKKNSNDLISFDDDVSIDQNNEITEDTIYNILEALKAINNLLQYNPGMEELCNSNWITIFIVMTLKDYPQLQFEALQIIHKSTKNAKCVENIQTANIMGYFLPMMVYFSHSIITIYECFEAMFTNIKLIKECMNKGVLIYLLSIFCESREPTIRYRTASIFARLIADKLSGPRIKIILLKFLPHIFLDAIMDDVEASVLLFESNQENPELIWNEFIRSHVSKTVNNMKIRFFDEQKLNSNATFFISDEFSCFTDYHTQNGNEMMVNGVYLKLFIAQPGWVLRRPKEFLISILDKIVSYYNINLVENLEHKKQLELCTKAFVLLVTTQQHTLDNIPQLGHLNRIVTILGNSIKENNKIVTNSTIKCINAISRNSFCCKSMTQNQNLIKSLIESFKLIPELCEEIGETLSFIFSHKLREYIMIIINQNLLKDLVNLLELQFNIENKKVTTSTRAHIVRAIQYLAEDEINGLLISVELDKFPIWKDYKNQRHDLFIDEPTIQQVGYTGIGVAGYLTAAHNTKTTNIKTQSQNLLLTQMEPPPPPLDIEDDE